MQRVVTYAKVKRSHTGLGRPLGLQEVEAPRFLDNRHMKVVRLLRMLLVYSYIGSYLKSVLRYKYLILDAYIILTLYIYVSKDVRIRRYFSKPKRGPRANNFGNTGTE
jgi:hypothetical protein